MDEPRSFGQADRTHQFDEGGRPINGSTGKRVDRVGFDSLMVGGPSAPAKPKRPLLGIGYAGKLRVWEVERREWARTDAERRMRAGNWGRPMTVLVVNQKGSSGKTPTVLGTAGALAQARPGAVAAIEVGESKGTLLDRAEGLTPLGLADMLKNLGKLTTRSAIDSYGLPQSSGATVFGSPSRRRAFSAEDVATIGAIIDQYYPITVADSANNEMAPGFAKALEKADALIIPTTLSMDSARAVSNIMDFLETRDEDIPFRPELWERTVVVITHDGRRDNPRLAAGMAERVRAAGMRVVEIPFDDHIAQGEEIVYARLAESTREAYREVALQLAECFSLAEADDEERTGEQS
jgi:MinD-like ATPase involved in chromosome partitioning or flagellar assembly